VCGWCEQAELNALRDSLTAAFGEQLRRAVQPLEARLAALEALMRVAGAGRP
jgi:hypothetical protein